MTKILKILAKHAKGVWENPSLTVAGGFVAATDGLHTVSAPCDDLPEGVYHAAGFGESFQPILFPGGPETTMPPSAVTDDAAACHVKPEQADALDWVMRAASTEETRYYLNGLHFDGAAQKIVATDGHRLHALDHEIVKGGRGKSHHANPTKSHTLPTTAARLMIDLIRDTGCETEILFGKDRYEISIGAVLMRGPLVGGEYPNWQIVVPDYEPGNVTDFNPAEIFALLPELKAMAKAAGMNQNLLYLNLEDGAAHSRFRSDCVADRSWPISMKIPFKIGFDAKYLADLCGGRLSWLGASDPVKIAGDDGRMSVLMPAKV